jgi:hypothetical protein
MATRNNDAFPSLGGGGAATNISTDDAQPPGTAAPGSTGDVSDAGHVHRHSYLSELNAWGVPTAWNANTNSPALASGTGNATNTAFVVTTAGSTTLDGISTWVVGDIAYFDATADVWKKVSVDPFESVAWASRGSGDFTGQIKRITDVGNTPGTLFTWDGTYWRPTGGRLCLVQRWGTNAAPLAGPLTGAATHAFTLPAAAAIPAGLITPHSQIYIRAYARRSGATATANFDVTLGTTNSSSDTVALRTVLNATDNHVARIDGPAMIGAFSSGKATTYLSNGVVSPQNSTAVGSSYADRSTNFDTSLAMNVNFGISSANAADSFSLHGYAVYLEP